MTSSETAGRAGGRPAGTARIADSLAGTAGRHAGTASGPSKTAGEPGAARRAPCRQSRLLVPLAVAAGYLAMSVVVFRSAWTHLGDIAYGGGDAVLFTWYLGWTPHALAGGLDPFVTHHLNAPDGANLLWSTPVFLLGLVAAPVTTLFGPVTSLTVLITLAPALSGFALFWVLRRWVRAGPAALAGLLYGFGPYMIGESYGHLHLTFVPIPPLLLLLLDDLVVRGRRPVRTGVLLGLALAAQALIGEEILATSVLVAVLGLAVHAVRHRDQVRSRLAPTFTGLGVAGAVAIPLLAWPLTVQFFGDQRVTGPIQKHGIAVSDLLTFVTPTPMQRIAPADALAHSLGFTGNAVEVGGYLGIPLIVAIVALGVWQRRDPLVGLFAPLGVIMAVLSLGGHLHVDGRATRIPLPWLPFQHLPLLSSALPSRFAMYVGMSAAVVVAVGVDRLLRAGMPRPDIRHAAMRDATARTTSHQSATPRGTALGWTALRTAAAGLVVATLIPLVPAPLLTTSMRTPPFFTGEDVTRIPKGGTALVVPFPHPQAAEAMLWQARADYRFIIPGCYCTVPGPDGRASFHGPADALTSALIDINNGAATAATAVRSPQVRAAYDRLAPDAVVLGPARHGGELRILLGHLVGTSPRRIGGVDLWLTGRPHRR